MNKSILILCRFISSISTAITQTNFFEKVVEENRKIKKYTIVFLQGYFSYIPVYTKEAFVKILYKKIIFL